MKVILCFVCLYVQSFFRPSVSLSAFEALCPFVFKVLSKQLCKLVIAVRVACLYGQCDFFVCLYMYVCIYFVCIMVYVYKSSCNANRWIVVTRLKSFRGPEKQTKIHRSYRFFTKWWENMERYLYILWN